jgi:hypothetical protein
MKDVVCPDKSGRTEGLRQRDTRRRKFRGQAGVGGKTAAARLEDALVLYMPYNLVL